MAQRNLAAILWQELPLLAGGEAIALKSDECEVRVMEKKRHPLGGIHGCRQLDVDHGGMTDHREVPLGEPAAL